MYAAGDVRVEELPDPVIQLPTDAIVRVTASCVCGSDLHSYHGSGSVVPGKAMGHEFVGIVEEVGSDVATMRPGDFVIAPFVWSDGTCDFCQAGLHTSCRHGGFWGEQGAGVGQSDIVRVPYADGTLVKLDGIPDASLIPSLLTLSDVYCTGWHAAITAGVTPGSSVTVIGDGAVGLLAVLSAKQLGAEQIVLMGRHTVRTDLGREFGATDVVAERGDEGIERVRDLTGGDGTQFVLEAVGYLPAYEQALGVVRDGGVISRVGVPQYAEGPIGRPMFLRNITLTGGVAPARAYIEQLLPAVLDGTVQPGRVFDSEVQLDDIADAYRAMDARESIKVLVHP